MLSFEIMKLSMMDRFLKVALERTTYAEKVLLKAETTLVGVRILVTSGVCSLNEAFFYLFIDK